MSALFKKTAIVAAAAIVSIASFNASAVDSVALEYGTGNQTDMTRVSGQWNWKNPIWSGSGSQLVGQWDLSLSNWRSKRFNNVPGSTQDLQTIGITPVLRWQAPNAMGLYGEAGLGAHYLTSIYNNNGSQLSTHYQFGSLLGVGYRFTNNLEFGARIQHFSNGGFKQPNTGVNFAIVRGAYRF